MTDTLKEEAESLFYLRDDPLPVAEGWTIDLYCKYSNGVAHDMETHGVSFYGYSRVAARRKVKKAGWIIHRDRTASCRRCVAATGGASRLFIESKESSDE